MRGEGIGGDDRIQELSQSLRVIQLRIMKYRDDLRRRSLGTDEA